MTPPDIELMDSHDWLALAVSVDAALQGFAASDVVSGAFFVGVNTDGGEGAKGNKAFQLKQIPLLGQKNEYSDTIGLVWLG